MRPLLSMLAVVLAAVLPATPAQAADSPYVAQSVEAWASSPIYLSPEAGQLAEADADELADRITGWRDDVFVTVLPAVAMGDFPGESEPEQAARFLDAAADAQGDLGVYVVSFGGQGTYGASYGTDDEVGPIVAEQVRDHTLGQSDQILSGILDELGAPGGGGGLPWLPVGLGALVVIGLLAGVGLWLRRPHAVRRPSGEEWAGEADFAPSFRVQPDETQTLTQRAALAHEDVIRLGEELDAADLPATDSGVAAHLQAALDTYADLSRRVAEDDPESATGPKATEAGLRKVDADLEYARWQLACARARLDGTTPPPRRSDCFVDASHGTSVADMSWAPPDGVRRPVPVCRACFERMTTSTSQERR